MVDTAIRTEFDQRLDDAVESLERCWREQGVCDLAEHLPSELDDPGDRAVAIELMCVDMQYRWKSDDQVTVADYRRQFPKLLPSAAELEPLVFEEYRMRQQSGLQLAPAEIGATYGVDASTWPTLIDAGDDTCGVEQLGRAPFDYLDSPNDFPFPGDRWGEFELVEELGRGTFAVVYLARQAGLANRDVVLKLTNVPTVEPANLARLQHTNIVPIHSVHSDGQFQAICMPFFGRRTLADELALNTTDTAADNSTRNSHQDRVLRIVHQIALGIQHAHQAGVVHRDIKPANILLADNGTAMLLDFNLSDDTLVGGRAAAIVGGTLPYLAPEHLRSIQTGTTVGPQADLYSLGIVAYELFTNLAPFARHKGQFDEVIEAMVADRAAPQFESLDQVVSPSIAAVIRRLLAADMHDRYQSAAELIEDLERHFSHRPLCHAPNPSILENARKFRARHPKLCSGAAVGAFSLAAFLVLLASFGVLRNRYISSQSELKFNELVAFAPRARAALSIPTQDVVGPILETTRAKLEPYELARFDIATHQLSQSLSAQQQAQLQRVLCDLSFLVALQETRRYSHAHDTEVRLEAHQAAVEYNRYARRLHKGTDSLALIEQHRLLTHGRRTPEQHQSGTGSRLPASDFSLAPDVTWAEVVWLLDRAQYQQAIDPLEAARDRDGHDPSVWLLLGNAYAGCGRLEDAIHCYTVCTSLWPDSHLGFFQRGLALFHHGEFQAALDDYDRCLEFEPGNASVLINRAAAHKALGDLQAAERDLSDAIASGCQQTRLYFLRADVRQRRGDSVGADEDRQRGFDLTPVDAESYARRGFELAATDPQRALEDLTRALELRPGYRVAMRNMAYVLGERQGDLDAALDVLHASFGRNGHADDLASIAVYEARKGNRTAARDYAAKLIGRSPTAKQWFQLACVYALAAEAKLDENVDEGSETNGDAAKAAERQADRETAVVFLERALTRDARWFQSAATDDDLKSLHQTPSYNEVMATTQRRLKRQAGVDAAEH